MEKLLQDFVSAYWWVSVVIVGIVINIISAYIKPFLENRLGRISDYWKKRQEFRIETFNHHVSILKANDHLRSVYALREVRYRIRSVYYLVFASISFVIATWSQNITSVYVTSAVALIGAVSMIISLDDHFDAIQVKKLIDASIDSIRELHP